MPIPPDVDAWQSWRASLPAVPALAGIQDPRGLRHAMRAALAEVQGHQCALCLAAGKFLVLDHEHETCLARGMLCRSCNGREGTCPAGSDPVIDAYRANPPAAGAGWSWVRPGLARPGRARRLGRLPEARRVQRTIRILAATDKRLTAAVEQTGESPQYVVDAALAAYFDALGIR